MPTNTDLAITDLIDRVRYPLEDVDLIDRTNAQLAEGGYAVLEGFIRAEKIAAPSDAVEGCPNAAGRDLFLCRTS